VPHLAQKNLVMRSVTATLLKAPTSADSSKSARETARRRPNQIYAWKKQVLAAGAGETAP
jgi:hypothetical protein